MSDFSELKALINTNIRQNGRQEITGEVMNDVLNTMVDDINEKKSDPVTISQNTQTGGLILKLAV